ncbi:DUF3159 domain-containing protein [Streptomyces sp. NPDC058268]|uniref:DUF3159 domain-containing protein n=1 Tax=Streptomyces sp. NPDC058268 TaxID=3346413 RepID=UPI0036E6BCC6
MREHVRPDNPQTGSHQPHETTARNAKPTPLEQMGGSTGLVYTMLPIVAFVLANASLGLTAAICTAVGVALAVTGLRLVRPPLDAPRPARPCRLPPAWLHALRRRRL